MCVINKLDSFSPLPPEVEALWREGIKQGSPEAALTASPEWFRIMAAGNPQGANVVVLKNPDDSEGVVFPMLSQVMPLEFRIAGVRLGGVSLRVLRVCGGDLIERSLTAKGLREVWTAVFQGNLFSSSRAGLADAILMDHVQEGRRKALVLESAARHPRCFAGVWQSRQPHHYAMLGAGAADAGRSATTRKRLVRYERALASAAGEVKVLEFRTEQELMDRAEEIEFLMNHAWQAEWLGLTADLKAQVPVARAGLLRSWLLEAGGKPVAFLLGYQGGAAGAVSGCQVAELLSESPKDSLSPTTQQPTTNNSATRAIGAGGVVCLHQIGYAQSMAKFSPGTLLLTHVMDTLAGEGPLVVDFGSGEAGYKEHFTNETGWSSRIMVVRRTARLRVILGLYHVTVALDRGIRRLLKTMRIKDWIVRKLKHGSGG